MEEELPIVHDGDRVREIVEKSTFSYEEFEREMGWNTTKRYRMFRRGSWNSQQLMQASKVLNYDFFNVYRVWTRNAMKTTTILVPVTVSLPLDFEVVDFGNLEQVFRPAPDPPEK